MICPKCDTGGGPCYCQPPKLKVTFNMKGGGRITTTGFSDADSAIVGLNISRDMIRTTNTVRLPLKIQLSSAYGHFGVDLAEGPDTSATMTINRSGLPAEALDMSGIKAGQRTWSIKAQTIYTLIEEVINAYDNTVSKDQLIDDLNQYAAQLARGEL
jgi:hypothetical protein